MIYTYPPKNAKIAVQTPRTSRLSTFYYCQVVNRALLRLLRTCILVSYRVVANYIIKLGNILYHWELSMASFRFCETYLLHIKPFVVNKSAMSPFLGGCKGMTIHVIYILYTHICIPYLRVCVYVYRNDIHIHIQE